MKKMRTILSLTLTMIMLFTLLTACGQENKTPDTPANEPAGSVAPDADSGAVEGTVTFCLESAKKTAFEPFIEAFEKEYPGINVEVLWDKDDNTLIAANQAPDLIKSGDIHVSSSRDLLLDLTPYMEQDAQEVNADDFFPATLESYWLCPLLSMSAFSTIIRRYLTRPVLHIPRMTGARRILSRPGRH